MDGNYESVPASWRKPVKRKVFQEKPLEVLGYNRSCPGPTIQLTQENRGSRVSLKRLPGKYSLRCTGKTGWKFCFVRSSRWRAMDFSQKPGQRRRNVFLRTNFKCTRRNVLLSRADSAMQEMMGPHRKFSLRIPKEGLAPAYVTTTYGIVCQEGRLLPPTLCRTARRWKCMANVSKRSGRRGV